MNLYELNINQVAIIKKININENIKKRLLNYGMRENIMIKPVFCAITGNPRAYEVKQTLIVIRNEDAMQIEVMS